SFTQYLSSGLITSLIETWASDIKVQLFNKIIYQSLDFYHENKLSELVQALNNDVDSFKTAAKSSLIQGTKSLTQCVGAVLSLFIISPKITLFVTASLPTIFFIGNLLTVYLRALRNAQQNLSMKANSSLMETVTNIRSVKALALEDFQQQLYNSRLAETSDKAISFGYVNGAFQGLSLLCLRGLVLGVAMYASFLVQTENLAIADVSSVVIGIKDIQASLFSLSHLFVLMIKGADSSRRILRLLNLPDGSSKPAPLKPHQLSLIQELNSGASLSVSINNLTFNYNNRPDHPVLKRVSLEIKPGSTVAIVGSSGAGKSTLFSLLERFYEPKSGSISIGGVNIHEIPVAILRRFLIGYMSQETQIFNCSVMENIRCARPDASDDQVIAAAKLAQADEFIKDTLPQGYQTVLVDGSLSGGQKQRISIARILLKDSPIVLMDEATANLDPISEALVHKSLKVALKGRTVIVIAHKLATVKNADLIAVFKNGEIVETGTHAELVAINGEYVELLRHNLNE
ncbi:ATP-binding cassette, sub-B (MDR TAP), member 8, partial [Cichlidogyrus casuarinus]